ncbi:MAG: UTP--glucose-1-phosphate uridylyltransferase [Candidatus Saelkia tenebricola]|nr:UTP--glucose-1-phosphate uridylyltransferase [Candidatus Saelkia tenebricola]
MRFKLYCLLAIVLCFQLFIPVEYQNVSLATRRSRSLPQIAVNWERFKSLAEQYRNGELSGATNNPMPGEVVLFPAGQTIDYASLTDEEKARYTQAGEQILRDGKFAILYLAGGAGSRFDGPKMILAEVEIEGRPRTPMQALCENTLWAEEQYGGTIPILMSTSEGTNSVIGRVLEMNDNYGLTDEQIVRFQDESSGIRFVPRVADLELLLPAKDRANMSDQDWADAVAFCQEHGGKSFVDLYREGVITDPNSIYCGTGNDILPSFVAGGGLKAAIESGVEIVYIRNDANYGSTVDPVVIGAFVELQNQGIDVMTEIVTKEPGETGGVAALVDGRPRVLETPRMPNDLNQDNFPAFNTNTFCVSVDGLLEMYGFSSREEFLEVAEDQEELSRRVHAAVRQFHSTMVVRIKNGLPVLEFQNVLGPDMSQVLDMGFMQVVRDDRYLNLKSPEDIAKYENDIRRVLSGYLSYDVNVDRVAATGLKIINAYEAGKLNSSSDQTGERTYNNVMEWLGHEYGQSWKEIAGMVSVAEKLEADSKGEDMSGWAAIQDAFYKNAEFGTAGMRGEMGVGPNRINIFAVRRVAQAVADDLKAKFDASDLADRPYIISYDTRDGSKEFAQEAASILAANGIKVAIATEDRPIGWFAHIVPTLNGLGGMMITASHNPVGNNGIKLSAAYGGQLLPEDGAAIADNYPNVELSSVQTMDYAQAKEEGLISELGEAENEEYMASVLGLARDNRLTDEDRDRVTIVYDALYGTDRETTPDAQRDLGHNVVEVSEHAINNPKFPGVPAPNPTVDGVLDLAREQANGIIGEEVQWRQLTGDETWTLMTEYLLNRMLEDGVDLRGKKIVRSWVTTGAIDAVVAKFNEKHGLDIEVIVTPVGFKWIGGLAENDPSIIAGFEESNGGTLLAHSLEKDGTLTAALFSEAIAYWNQQLNPDGQAIAIISNDADGDRLVVEIPENSVVVQQLDRIRAECGEINNIVDNTRFEGPEGMAQRDSIVDSLATNPPAALGAFEIAEIQTEILGVADGVRIILENGSLITLRKSGTEPIMRIYIEAVGDTSRILVAIKGYVAEQLALMN